MEVHEHHISLWHRHRSSRAFRDAVYLDSQIQYSGNPWQTNLKSLALDAPRMSLEGELSLKASHYIPMIYIIYIYIINYICVCVDSKLPTSIIIHPHLINHGSLNPIKFPGIFRPNFRTSLEVLPQLSRYLPRSSQRVTDDIPGEAHEMEISIP